MGITCLLKVADTVRFDANREGEKKMREITSRNYLPHPTAPLVRGRSDHIDILATWGIGRIQIYGARLVTTSTHDAADPSTATSVLNFANERTFTVAYGCF